MARERTFTEKEIKRRDKVFSLIEEYKEMGYLPVDLSVDIYKANRYAFLLWLPFAIVMIPWYVIVNHSFHQEGILWIIAYLLLFCIFIVLHELIHGFTWGMMAKKHFKSIDFGIMRDTFTPYCTCTEPLNKRDYILGSFMPCLLVGIIPSVVGIYMPSFLLFVLGQTLIMGAGGDITVIIKLLKFNPQGKDVVYIDHPTECGLIALVKGD